MLSQPLYHITLKDSRPKENRHRVYTIAVYALANTYSITLLWGRIGTKKQRKIQTCESQEALTTCLTAILKTRLKHGYLLAEKSTQTPDYEILSKFQKANLWGARQLSLF